MMMMMMMKTPHYTTPSSDKNAVRLAVKQQVKQARGRRKKKLCVPFMLRGRVLAYCQSDEAKSVLRKDNKQPNCRGTDQGRL